ncbi:unnamed protein product [Linum trigynum]|uniref:HTH La-type RNA-binding domain-containing protein n=1 Tax=Linum trigynum TaxID=586398 RepID=A0AAV2FI15_9ROSI
MSFSSPESTSAAGATPTRDPHRRPPHPLPAAPIWFSLPPGPCFIGPPRPIPIPMPPAMSPPPPHYHPRWPLLRPNPVWVNWALYVTHIRSAIRNQVEYYFSRENLIKDWYLRKHMDEQGWVEIGLIAGFNRVSRLTGDVNVVVDALRNSSVVEVCEDKVRRRGDWSKWASEGFGLLSRGKAIH